MSEHDQHTKVERETVLPASPDEVWESLTDDGLLSEWLAVEVELDPVEGGELSVRDDDGEMREGTVETVVEHERLAFTWARPDGEPSRVDLRVESVPGVGTRLLVTETRIAGPVALAVATWGPRLLRLERALRMLPVA